MKYKHALIYLFSFLLFLVSAFWGCKEAEWKQMDQIYAIIPGDNPEIIDCWEDTPGVYYFFLPSYADLSQIRLGNRSFRPVYINGQLVTEEMDCGVFTLNEPAELMFTTFLGNRHYSLTFVQSANVPTLYIDVESGSMEYIHSKKGNKEAGSLRLYSIDGQLEHMTAIESLQGRGNATWELSEKAYSLTLPGELDFLDMGNAQKWVLLANGYDYSHLRNKIAFELARKAGMLYSPDCQWVDLYLNGEYTGLYLLSERNEIHPNRVNIPAESSFLVSWEGEWRLMTQGYPYVKTESGTAIRIHQSAFSAEKIQRLWQSAENAIFADDGIDPVTGKQWQELIDLDSWAMLFLMDEISADHDGGMISKFFYYNEADGTGKIFAGPVWDKDITFNSGHWHVSAPNAIVAGRAAIENGVDYSVFSVLYQKEAFSCRIKELYRTTFRPLLKDYYDTVIAQYADQIASAAACNQIRRFWTDAKNESLVIRNFIRDRMEFLDAYWMREEAFCIVRMEADVPAEFAVRPGECLPYIPDYEGYAWFVEGTDVIFDVTQPIYEDTALVLRELKSDDDSVDITGEIMIITFIVAGVLVLSGMDWWKMRAGGRKNGRNQ